MPYLDAVVKESMRLYPVAPFVVRRLTSKISLPGESGHRHNAITLPASTFACVWIYALHRRPDLWSHPDTFLPERWIDPALRDRGRDEPGAYLPFALGPRHCLGRPLATTALRVLLARILGRYICGGRSKAGGIVKRSWGGGERGSVQPGHVAEEGHASWIYGTAGGRAGAAVGEEKCNATAMSSALRGME